MNKPASLDPSLFHIVPRVAVVDEFLMRAEDGTPIANLTPEYLGKLVAHMNEREAATGDLAPLVVAHNPDGPAPAMDEAARLCGFARNWVVDDFFATGRKAAFADFWILKDKVETVRMLPRRSAEVWAARYEIDPIALLGPTTPARDLGLLKLSRSPGGSLQVTLDGQIMPDMPNDKSGSEMEKIGSLPIFQEILGLLKQVAAGMTAAKPEGETPAPAAPVPGQPEGGAEPSDAEIEEMLKNLGGEEPEGEEPPEEEGEKKPDEGRKADEPVKNAAGCPGGLSTAPNKLQREVNELRVQLARQQVETALTKLRTTENVDVNPDDQELVADLIAMPPEIRARQLQRLAKGKKLPGANGAGLQNALRNASSGEPAYTTDETKKQQIVKLARDKNITYEQAFAETMGRAIGR